MLYADSNAWISWYRPEEGRRDVISAMFSATGGVVGSPLVSAEVERALYLQGRTEEERRDLVGTFRRDWGGVPQMRIDDDVWRDAREIAGPSRLRIPDAIHLALLRRIGRRAGLLLTFDKRLATAASDLGFSVVGGTI